MYYSILKYLVHIRNICRLDKSCQKEGHRQSRTDFSETFETVKFGVTWHGSFAFQFFFVFSFYFIGFVSLNMGCFCCKLSKVKSFFRFSHVFSGSRQNGHQKHNIPQELIWVSLFFVKTFFAIFSFPESVPT